MLRTLAEREGYPEGVVKRHDGRTLAMISLQNLLDDAKCYETIRPLRGRMGCAVPNGHGRNTAVSGVSTLLMIGQGRYWRVITNRCGYGFMFVFHGIESV